jgi:hypothetical protein
MNPRPPPTDSMDASELDRVRGLLPWYAQGQLDAPKLAFITHWLENNVAHHPDITAELAWLRSTASTLQAQRQAQAPSPEQGLSALMQRIAQERTATGVAAGAGTAAATPAPARRPPLHSAPPLAERVAQWLADALGLRSPVMAFGLAAVVLAQAGVIGALLLGTPAEQAPLAGAGSASAPAGQVLLTVAFSPSAAEQAMRQVLTQANASIVAGPSALGLYTLAVPSAQAASATALLRAATGIVVSVQP